MARPVEDLRERFCAKLRVGRKSWRGTRCYEWTAARDRDGYGLIWWKGKLRKAHVVSWYLATGRVPPPGVLVCHGCDNRRCSRKSHLFLGGPKKNTADAFRKGRR